MLKIFSRNKTFQEDQQELFFYLEKIVNIALTKTERSDNQSVKEILKDLEDIFRKFWKLKKDNPSKFEALLWSRDFFENYVKPIEESKDLTIEGSEKAKSAEELKQEAATLLTFSAERELKGLTQFLNSFKKIWECAFKYDNDEISKYVVYHLIWLLSELVKEPSNNLIVVQFLKLLNSINWKAIKFSKKEINISAFAASIHWYTDIVFDRLELKEGSFNLSYLEIFDTYFFYSIRNIISENQTSLFKALISTLVDGVFISPYNSEKIWNYWYLITPSNTSKYNKLYKDYSIKNRIEELVNSGRNIDTKEKLDKWVEKFDEFKKILEPHLNEEQKEKVKKIEEEIKEFIVSKYKYNNLLNIVFAIGAYCLFKQKIDYIKYLWEYKQPPDSDASWTGHDIVPNSINNLISFYFNKLFLEWKFDFREEHHGSRSYYRKYFLLILTRILQTIKPNSEGKFEQIDNYDLPEFNIHRLSGLEYSIDNLVEIAKDMKKQADILENLGFNINENDETFDKKLIPFLKGLKTKAQERIGELRKESEISPEKIEKFKKQVLKEFNELVVLRNIFKHYKLYEDKTMEKYEGELGRFGINRIDEKVAFLKEWYVDYSNFGRNYSRDLANSEDSDIIGKIMSFCKEVEETNFEKILEEFGNLKDIIIFATNVALYRFFENKRNFKPKWYKDSPKIDIKGFQGMYVFNEKYIPIFVTYHREIKKQILILNKSKLGRLIQYSPLNEGESEQLKKDIFYMNIQSFSENQQLMNDFISKSPDWLKKKGSEDKQIEYLREKALIQIYERFEYIKHENFEGYLLKLTN